MKVTYQMSKQKQVQIDGTSIELSLIIINEHGVEYLDQ
jgi:hypothetical protein